jgi:gamma-glutamylcyclotransferase (GGCT)/AIG2-like uncharacterized protein YtfP
MKNICNSIFGALILLSFTNCQQTSREESNLVLPNAENLNQERIDTITVYDFETQLETVYIVKSGDTISTTVQKAKYKVVEKIDTIKTFNKETQQEEIKIEKNWIAVREDSTD